MTRMEYVKTVLDEVEKYGKDQAAFIVSAGREMDEETVKECIGIAKSLKAKGRRVVGVDLCGDPLRGDVDMFCRHFADAKNAGSGSRYISQRHAYSFLRSGCLLTLRFNRLKIILNLNPRRSSSSLSVLIVSGTLHSLMMKPRASY